jgi:hypothetical protein
VLAAVIDYQPEDSKSLLIPHLQTRETHSGYAAEDATLRLQCIKWCRLQRAAVICVPYVRARTVSAQFSA